MDKVLQRSSQVKGRGYLFDFITSAYPSHLVSGILGIIAALIIWSMLSHKLGAAPTVRTAPYAPPPNPIALAQEVAMAHIFGQDATAETAAGPPAAVNISVEGIIYSEDKDSALAILKIDGNSNIFRVGDTLPDGEKLLTIAPTAVQLGRPGAPRAIEMQQDFGDGGGALLADGGSESGRAAFPGMHAAVGPAAYASVLKPVFLSRNSSPLTQLRSLRQQLIRQQPSATQARTANTQSKP